MLPFISVVNGEKKTKIGIMRITGWENACNDSLVNYRKKNKIHREIKNLNSHTEFTPYQKHRETLRNKKKRNSYNLRSQNLITENSPRDSIRANHSQSRTYCPRFNFSIFFFMSFMTTYSRIKFVEIPKCSKSIFFRLFLFVSKLWACVFVYEQK